MHEMKQDLVGKSGENARNQSKIGEFMHVMCLVCAMNSLIARKSSKRDEAA
jgi:hypothetical protein